MEPQNFEVVLYRRNDSGRDLAQKGSYLRFSIAEEFTLSKVMSIHAEEGTIQGSFHTYYVGLDSEDLDHKL